MATAASAPPAPDRVARRRQAVVDEALDHAVAVMTELGVGGLSISEVARRMGMRGPSLYKYFPSLHALYDALFARALTASLSAMRAVAEAEEPGVPRLRAGGRAIVAWCTVNPASAQLLFWRPVPGFEPSPEVFQASVQDMAVARAELTEAVRRGQLAPDADSDTALRLYTVVLSGLISQHMANEPDAPYAEGRFSTLTDTALDMFFRQYAPADQ